MKEAEHWGMWLCGQAAILWSFGDKQNCHICAVRQDACLTVLHRTVTGTNRTLGTTTHYFGGYYFAVTRMADYFGGFVFWSAVAAADLCCSDGLFDMVSVMLA